MRKPADIAFAKLIALIFLLFVFQTHALAEINIAGQAPKKDIPIEVRLTLHINKIYNINPVEESYTVDAYLTADWIDPRVRDLIPDGEQKIVFEDNLVEDIRDQLWTPSLELINITGPKEISNKRLFIHTDGKVIYTERFKAVMNSEMNFRKFPFDSQKLKVIIEPFAYSAEHLVFSDKSQIFPIENNTWPMTEWSVTGRYCQINRSHYEFLADISGELDFSQFELSINIERIPDYFIYQIIIPLIIIMLCAWSVHFINDSATQLSLISTLMLTVYAFNFFIADSIPKLPYNTFLGKMIVISFCAIFLQLICHIIQLNTKREFGIKQNGFLVAIFALGFIIASCISWHFSSQEIRPDISITDKNTTKQCIEMPH